MTDKQVKIHEGLNSIRPEIAQFYSDGVDLVNSEIKSKSNLIGHLLREIESGLRDVFEQKKSKEEFQKKLTTPEVIKLFEEIREDYKEYEYLKDVTSEDFAKVKGHISSILISFGLEFNSKLAKQYIKLAIFFHKYAHRSGSYARPRSSHDIERIWSEFEEILSVLIGNYYAIAERIDALILLESPTDEILKALPNILKDDSRNVYFFSNLKQAGWLKSLSDNGYFNGKLNPEPISKEDDSTLVSIPYWPVLNYLEHISMVNAQNPNDEVSELLVSIISNIISYRKSDGNRIENFRTDYSVFKMICNLPDNLISKTHLDFIESTFDSKWEGLIGYDFGELIDRLLLLENKELLLNSISILLKHKIDEAKPIDKLDSVFREYDLGRIISEHKEKLIAECGNEILDISIQKINEITNIDISSFNNFTIPTIEEHSQTRSPEKFECQLVFLVRDCFEKLPAEDISEKLIELLNKEQPIFKRIALHVIRKRYSEFRDIFWSWNDNPLAFPLIKHELYELIKQNAGEFTDDHIELVLNWIESKQYYTEEDFNGDAVQMNIVNAYRKKEWVSSLLDTGNESVIKKHQELDAINDAKIEHPGFDTWFSSSYGYSSPLTNEEIAEKTIEEIIGYTSEYTKEKHDFMGDSVEGLSFMITSDVTANLNKYTTSCNALINAPHFVLYAWMNGLNDILRNNNDIPTLTAVYDILVQIVSNQGFKDTYNSDERYSNWFISSLIRFVESVLKNDSINISESDLDKLKTVLLEIYKFDNSEIDDYKDLPMTVLNNSKGKIYTALFEFSLRKARMEQKENNRWDDEIKALFTTEVASGLENPLLFCVLGQYLPNINYLDTNWLNEFFPVLFSRHNTINWNAIMTGYLYFHNRPNNSLFKLLTENDDYELAIVEPDNFHTNVIQHLVSQLCGAYLNELNGFTLENSLMKTLISSNDKSIISAYTYFFWSPNNQIPQRYIDKIKFFWKSVIDSAKEMKNVETDRLKLSAGFKWLSNFNELDDELYEWLMIAAPYIEQSDKYFAYQNLEKLVIKSPEKVGNILIELFKNGVSYDISRGRIATMVQVLYDNGLKEIADTICNMHGEKGIHFLRDVFQKNKS